MKKSPVVLIALCGLVLAASPRPAPGGEVRHHIRGTTFASEVQQRMSGMKLKLNNHNGQTSFVEVGGFQLRFDIARTTVDIDCGTLCPDLGDGHFYVNDVSLQRANLGFGGSDFTLTLAFEGSGREVKGYHNKLGDDFMPDFQLNNLRLNFRARPKLTSSGDMSLEFSSPKMDAAIQATGGCKISGIDVCNKIFGSNRRIQKSVESSALGALNGSRIQSGLAAVLKLYLQSKNITGKILGVGVQNADLLITAQSSGGTPTVKHPLGTIQVAPASPAPASPSTTKPLAPAPGGTFQKRQ